MRDPLPSPVFLFEPPARKDSSRQQEQEARLVGRITGEFEIWQANAVDQDLIRADRSRSFEAPGAGVGNEIILVDAVAAYAKAPDQSAISIESGATREKDDAAFFVILGAALETLRTRVGHVHGVQAEERARAAAVDAGGKKRFRGESDGAVGNGGSRGNLI